MSKKDFSATFEGLTSTPKKEVQQIQEVQEVHTIQEAQAAQQTQGKKGYKMQRINMAFTPDNIEFLRLVSKVKGQTMTQLVNAILDQEREKQKELLDQIKALNANL